MSKVKDFFTMDVAYTLKIVVLDVVADGGMVNYKHVLFFKTYIMSVIFVKVGKIPNKKGKECCQTFIWQSNIGRSVR